MANKQLSQAKKGKEDEFYTQLEDIEAELKHYREHFAGKTVLCNCDDPRMSHFFFYFVLHFHHLGLKKLITTCYKNQDPNSCSENISKQAVYLVYEGEDIGSPPDPNIAGLVHPLQGDGDFRSPECINFLEEADIIVTNPPFSLFREYVTLLMEHRKNFIVIGNQNAITYKEVFQYIRNNQLWLGYKFGDMKFRVPDHYAARPTRFWIDKKGKKWRSLGNICWFTNLDIQKRHEELTLYKKYNPEGYPHYDNYDAINVNKTADIPCDYDGVMGVPITYLDKHNPNQFEIIGQMASTSIDEYNFGYPYINGEKKYARILIRKRK
jgi:modification methylase ecoRI